jgi:hypothetical protein
MGVVVTFGVELGDGIDAVCEGDGVSVGRTATVSLTGTGAPVSVARGAGIVGTVEGAAVNAGAVHASVIASKTRSRIKKRFLRDITSSGINF